jgi:hypothetical protein
VEGGGVQWGIVVLIGDNEGGRKESNGLEKLPVSEYEQVTCWFRVGLLDFLSNENLTKRTVTYLPNGYFVEVIKCNFTCNIMHISYPAYNPAEG